MINESSPWTLKETMQGVAMICVVALFLSIPTFHTKAKQMDYGKRQDAALWAAEPLYAIADSTGLAEPQQQIALRANRLWETPALADKVHARQTVSPLAPQKFGKSNTLAATSEATTSTQSPVPTMPPTTLPSLRTVSKTEPLRIWAGGDSLGQYIGARLQQNASQTQNIVINDNYQISTGLNRPDFYDWPGYLDGYFAEEQPDIAILMLGGNDNKVMKVSDQKLKVASDAWFKEYERRIATIIDAAEANKVHLYWVGLPPMQDDERNAIAQNTNSFLEKRAATSPWLTYISTVSYVDDNQPGFDTHLAGPDGRLARVRAKDGVHITKDPSDWITDDLYQTITKRWKTS